ncbi:MAG: matrixin family metalloprotease [Armatimonadetes bacterium]|nr:matrixin family metalloprotease [Armatimonadota bacterium]
MSGYRTTLSLLAFASVCLATADSLPKSVSSDVRNALMKAEMAIAEGDYELALALYEGSLYPTGITFAIDRSSLYADTDWQANAVYLALATWFKALDGDFPVNFVDGMEDADMVLSFVDEIDVAGPDPLGLIRLRKRYRWNDVRHEVSFDGTIQIVRQASGGRMTDAETVDVVMHELGHLLGLADVSRAGYLMGPMNRGEPIERPTDREVEDVRELRALLRQRIEDVKALALAAGR